VPTEVRAAVPETKWPDIDKELAGADPFTYLNFLLTDCPQAGPVEVENYLRARFARIGNQAGKPFLHDKFIAEQKAELEAGMKAGLEAMEKVLTAFGQDECGRRVGSPFGDCPFFNANWTKRANAAMAGVYGNDAVEAL